MLKVVSGDSCLWLHHTQNSFDPAGAKVSIKLPVSSFNDDHIKPCWCLQGRNINHWECDRTSFVSSRSVSDCRWRDTETEKLCFTDYCCLTVVAAVGGDWVDSNLIKFNPIHHMMSQVKTSWSLLDSSSAKDEATGALTDCWQETRCVCPFVFTVTCMYLCVVWWCHV